MQGNSSAVLLYGPSETGKTYTIEVCCGCTAKQRSLHDYKRRSTELLVCRALALLEGTKKGSSLEQ